MEHRRATEFWWFSVLALILLVSAFAFTPAFAAKVNITGRHSPRLQAGTNYALSFDGANDYVAFGRAVDTSGLAINSPAWVAETPISPAPPVYYSLQFNGSNQYVTFGPAPDLGAATFTLEAWIKRTGAGVTVSTGTGGVTAVPVLTKGRGEAEGSNVDMNYFLGVDSSGHVVADFEQMSACGGGAAGQNRPVIGTSVLALNIWYHVAATYDGQNFRLYVNGAD